MFNYLTPDSKFWLALLGHSAISVGNYIEQQGSVVGNRSSISSILHTKISEVQKLEASGMVSIKRENKNNKRIMTVTWLGWQPIPNIRLLCFALASMMDGGSIKQADARAMSWDHLFNQSVARSDMTEMAGVRPIGVVEVCIPNKNVKQTKPYIVVNTNQRATGSGFRTLESRQNYTVVYSREIQQIAQQSDILVLPEVETKEKYNKALVDWRPVPVAEWNADHLVNWIIDRMIEVYGTSPYNRKVIMQAGIKAEGVQGLERQQAKPSECPMEEYKGYVEWLLGHETFSVTPSNLTSPKIMQIYLVDRVHTKKKTEVPLPEAFNLE